MALTRMAGPNGFVLMQMMISTGIVYSNWHKRLIQIPVNLTSNHHVEVGTYGYSPHLFPAFKPAGLENSYLRSINLRVLNCTPNKTGPSPAQVRVCGCHLEFIS